MSQVTDTPVREQLLLQLVHETLPLGQVVVTVQLVPGQLLPLPLPLSCWQKGSSEPRQPSPGSSSNGSTAPATPGMKQVAKAIRPKTNNRLRVRGIVSSISSPTFLTTGSLLFYSIVRGRFTLPGPGRGQSVGFRISGYTPPLRPSTPLLDCKTHAEPYRPRTSLFYRQSPLI